MLIADLFFNIFNSGDGSEKHDHLNWHDRVFKLQENKFSLVYYLCW